MDPQQSANMDFCAARPQYCAAAGVADRLSGKAARQKGPGMEDNFEKYGVAVIIVFGALTIGGLMGANIGFHDRDGFLFALGSATAAWIAGHTMIFNRPRYYGILIAIAVLMAIASTLSLVL
jgi:hypothetical protein